MSESLLFFDRDDNVFGVGIDMEYGFVAGVLDGRGTVAICCVVMV